jgi:UDP-N-acetylmuramoyl-tripeptide--D-alanyl-D-alanine ligase
VNLTVHDLIAIPSLQQVGVQELGLNRTFRDVSTDSRTLKRGDLFVAIQGENFDGHTFFDKAAKQGALSAIVDDKWYKAQLKLKKKIELPILVVEDTLEAYGALARLYRMKFSIPVLVIAGSNGKTTTKEVIGDVLSATMGVLKTEENFNNQIGLPRMLFQLRDGHDIAVLEIGTNHPGEIAWLAKIANPTHALITNIGREHLEFFKDLKGVAAEERALFDVLFDLKGFAFINYDDKHLRSAHKQFGERSTTYGLDPEAFVSVQRLGFAKDGRVEFRVAAEGKSFKLRSHLIADYAANVIGAAVAVGLHFKLRRAEIKAALEHRRPHDKRLEVQRLPSGVILINDTYNANPDSMEAAFRTLKEFPSEGKKYMVLGDMFEMGESSAKEHRALGRKIPEFGFEKVFFTGKAMQAACKAANTSTENDQLCEYHEDREDIARALKTLLQPGDVLLVKGSRGMKMEDVIDLIQR